LLEPAHNTGFLRRCMDGFPVVNFADRATGRIYLRIESRTPVWMDGALMQSAISDPDTLSGIRAVAPSALSGGSAGSRRSAVSARPAERPRRADALANGAPNFTSIALDRLPQGALH